jgi:hypothetical protein
LVREVLHCRPGKVRALIERFKALSEISVEMGFVPFRLYTDVSGERFWTVVAESEFDSLDASKEMEDAVMGNEQAREVMAGYHELIVEGRREIFKIEM